MHYVLFVIEGFDAVLFYCTYKAFKSVPHRSGRESVVYIVDEPKTEEYCKWYAGSLNLQLVKMSVAKTK